MTAVELDVVGLVKGPVAEPPPADPPGRGAPSEHRDPAEQLGDLLTDNLGRGWRTTEFWVAIATWLLPITTLAFHRDLSSLAVPVATIAAGLANAAYALSRALAKHDHAKAAAERLGPTAAAIPAPRPAVDLADLTSWLRTMAGAVDSLSAALTAARASGPTHSA